MALRRSGWGRSALLIVLGLTQLNCSYSKWKANAPGAAAPDEVRLEALTRAQYEVIDAAQGEACAEFVALWPLPIFWVQSDGRDAERSFALFGLGAAARAERAANHRALESQPEADSLVEPKVYSQSRAYGWYKKTCVRVDGKAIRIKTDAEMSDRERLERPETQEVVNRD